MLHQVIVCSLLVISALYGASAQDCPRIVTRSEWGARDAETADLTHQPAPFAVIHHTVGLPCYSEASCAFQMRYIQSFHMYINGYADIGYNFCVGNDGYAYEGRGWGREGDHLPPYDNQSVGICIFGTFTSGLPSASALNAARNLLICGVSLGHIHPDHSIIGHRQVAATGCPGTSLFNEITSWPRFNASPSPVA